MSRSIQTLNLYSRALITIGLTATLLADHRLTSSNAYAQAGTSTSIASETSSSNPFLAIFGRYKELKAKGKNTEAIKMLLELNSLIQNVTATEPVNKYLFANRFLIGTELKELGRIQESLDWMIDLYVDYSQAEWPGSNTERANTANIISSTLTDTGRLTEAINYATKSIELNNPKSGDYSKRTHEEARYYLSRALEQAGQSERAKQILEDLHATATDPKLKEAAANDLGAILLSEEDYGSAKKYLIESTRTKAKDFSYAISLGNLATAQLNQGHAREGIELLTEALSIIKSENIYLSQRAEMLSSLAVAYADLGKYAKAVDLHNRAVREAELALGSGSLRTGNLIAERAVTWLKIKKSKNALSDLSQALAIQLDWLRSELPLLLNRSRIATQWRQARMHWQYPFSLAKLSKFSERLALDTRLNHQGLLAEIEQKQFILLNTSGVEAEKVKTLQALTQQLSSVTTNAKERDSAQKKHDSLQAELYRDIPQLNIKPTSPTEIAKLLPQHGALLEFQRFYPFDAGRARAKRWGKQQYIALILKKSGEISITQLGEAATIDEAIEKALVASERQYKDSSRHWLQISDKLLKPLLPQIADINQLFIAPDGETNRIPFAAIPAPHYPEKSLSEVVQLRILTTGRELIRLQQPSLESGKAVVIANPDYNRKGLEQTGPNNSTLLPAEVGPEGMRQPRELNSIKWQALPGTELEGKRIAELLNASLINGNLATSATLQRLQNPKVLHIATHGFFLPSREASLNTPLFALQEMASGNRALHSENPLLRSGLVLAGANEPETDPKDDGYLTAAEAVNLNLKGTELVVLSACSTGQGEVRTGEGVYGLQRSLTVAGARSTLLSLWKVDDAATAEFMVRYYQRLKAGEGRSDALAAVQEEFRSGKVQSGTGADWKEPYYWAAWQLVGDWRPIKGL